MRRRRRLRLIAGIAVTVVTMASVENRVASAAVEAPAPLAFGALSAGAAIAPPSPSLAVATATSTSRDYRMELRNLFGVSVGLASDEELDRILGSPHGRTLRAQVDLAYLGMSALDNDTAYREAVIYFFESTLLDFDPVEAASLVGSVNELYSGLDDLGLLDISSASVTALARMASSGILEGIAVLSAGSDIAHEMAETYVARDRRVMLQYYTDLRLDAGYSENEAKSEMLGVYFDVLDRIANATGQQVIDVLDQFAGLYEGIALTREPKVVESVRSYIESLVVLQRFYITGGPADGHGLVIVDQSIDQVTVVNDGPGEVTSIAFTNGDDRHGEIPYLPGGGRATVAVPSSCCPLIELVVEGMHLRLDVNDLDTSMWVGEPKALPTADPLAIRFTVDEPVVHFDEAYALSWDLGDGDSSSQTSFIHPYDCPGTKSVELQVIAGALAATRPLQTTVDPPFDLSWTGRAAGAPNVPLTFAVSDEVPTGSTVTWSFGDGSVDTGPEVSHPFASPGNYTVTVRATIPGSVCPPVTYDRVVSIGTSTTWVTLPTVIRHDTLLTSEYAGYLVSSPAGTTIAPGVTVTVEPGVIVKFAPSSYMVVEGSLVGAGSAGAPVVLTSLRDDSVGGATDGEGGTPPAPNDYYGLRASGAGVVSLSDAVIRYALDAVVLQNGGASVFLDRVTIEQVTSGVRTSDSLGYGSIDVSNSVIRGRGASVGSGIVIHSVAAEDLTVTNTEITDFLYGINVSGEVQLLSNSSMFARVGGEFRATPSTSDLRATGTVVADGAGRVEVSSGTFPAGVTRWTADLPFVGASNVAWAVPVGAQLVLTPGRIVKFAPSSYMVVEGSLVGAGSAGAPVVLTSLRDDSVGGATDGEGGTPPAPNDYYGLRASGAGVVSLSDAVIRYALDAVVLQNGGASVFLDRVTIEQVTSGVRTSDSLGYGSIDVSNSVIRGRGTSVGSGIVIHSVAAEDLTVTNTEITDFLYGINVSGEVQLTARLNRFLRSGSGIRAQSPATASAARNWWGSSSGPAPGGTGTPVVGTATVRPWCLDAACTTFSTAHLSFDAPTSEVSEGSTATITILRGGDTSVAVEVEVVGVPSTAAIPDDIADPSQVVNFAPGQTTASFQISAVDDAINEGVEQVVLRLVLPDGSNEELTVPHELILTILDDDPGPVITAGTFVANPEGNNGSQVYGLPVQLSEPSTQTVTIDWTTVDTSANPQVAQAGMDFVSTSGTMSFAPGETLKTIQIEILGDTVDEPPLQWGEWGLVSFSNPTNATLDTSGFFGLGVFIILDDDPTPVITAGTFVANPEGDDGPTIWELPVTLSNPSAVPVTVDWTTLDVPTNPAVAHPGSDYTGGSGTVTFAPGETTKTVSIAILGDTVDEPPLLYGEWGLVQLTNPTNATVNTGGLFGLGLFIILDDDP